MNIRSMEANALEESGCQFGRTTKAVNSVNPKNRGPIVMAEASVSVRTGSEVNHAPSVSVIMPAYNVASFIAEALDSVFAQTYRDFEVIVINDGSPDTDVFEHVLEPYLERIVYIKQQNRRAAGARNTGIRQARGEFLAFLDSDDSWTPDNLVSQMKLFEETPWLDMVYADAFYHPASLGKRYMDACPSHSPVTLEALVLEQCHVCVSCTVAHKRIIVDAGLFDETLPRCDDYDLWLRVACRGAKIFFHRKPLGWIRPERPGSLGESDLKVHEADLEIFRKLEKSPVLWPSARNAVTRAIAREEALIELDSARLSLSVGKFHEARASLKKANVFFESPKLKLLLLGLKMAPHLTALGGRVWKQFRTAHVKGGKIHKQTSLSRVG